MLLDILAPEIGKKPAELRSLISFVPDRPGHDCRYAIDCAKISRELGWRPSMHLEEGLAKTVRWYVRIGKLIHPNT